MTQKQTFRYQIVLMANIRHHRPTRIKSFGSSWVDGRLEHEICHAFRREFRLAAIMQELPPELRIRQISDVVFR